MNPKAQIKHYLDAAYRRRWWVIIPMLLGLVAGGMLLTRLPKLYQATTTILVTPQRMPKEFVRTTVTTRVEESIANLKVQILSRTYLEHVAKEFGVIQENASDGEIEAACRRLQGNVEILRDRREVSWFKILVTDTDPVRAAGVANRLAELFIRQNSELREEQASSTLREVQQWLDEKSELLDDKRAAIAQFKKTYAWELPSDLPSNLKLLDTANQQLASANAEIRSLENQIASLRIQLRNEPVLLPGGEPVTELSGPALELRKLEEELADLLVRYTDENPAVRRKRSEIEDFKSRNAEALAALAARPRYDGTGASGPVSPLQVEVARLEREKADKQIEIARIQSRIDTYTRRINITPQREAQLAALTRDLDSIEADYEEQLRNREHARRAEQMEASRKGEQFQVQDRAHVPTRPFKPQPVMVLLMSLAAGFGVGMVITALLEFANQTVRSEEHFQDLFPEVPVLVSVPSLVKKQQKQKHKKSA